MLVCTALSCGANEACVGGSCQCTGGYHEHGGLACHSTGTVHDACAGVTCPANASCSGGVCSCNSCYEDTGTDGVLVCTALSCGANEACVGGTCQCTGGYHEHDGRACHTTGTVHDPCAGVTCGVNEQCSNGNCVCVADYHEHDGRACHTTGTVHDTSCGTDEIGTPPNCMTCGSGEVPNRAGTACEACPSGQTETTAGQCGAAGTEGGHGHCTSWGAYYSGDETHCVAAGRVLTNGQCPQSTCPVYSTDNGGGVCVCDPGYVYTVPAGAAYGPRTCTARTVALCGTAPDPGTCGDGGTWNSGTATCDCDDGYEQSDDAQSCVCESDDAQSLGHQASVLFRNPQSLFDGLQIGFVNTSTGNLTFRRRDIVTRAQGPVVFARVYDSRIDGNDDFGTGWRLSLAEELHVNGDVVTYMDESGARYAFARAGTTWVANPPTPQHAATTIEFANVDGNRIAVLGDGDTVRTFHQTDVAGARYVVSRVKTPDRELVFDYDRGRLNTVAHDGRTLIQIERDQQGRVAAVRDNYSRSVRYRYDADGRLEKVRDIAGGDWRYLYGDNGVLAGSADPEGRLYLAAYYDSDGRVAKTFGEQSHGYAYGPDGTTVSEGTGDVYTLARNGPGVTTALSSTNGASWTVTLDAANRVTMLSLPDRSLGYTYGANGRVETETVADSIAGRTTVLSYAYDAEARLTSVSGSGADINVAYARGHVWIESAGEVFQYEVDHHGRVVSVGSGRSETIRVERDGAGDIVAFSQGSWSVRFGRNALGRIVDAAHADGLTARYFYDDLGNRTLAEYGDGSSVGYEHDTAGNMIAIKETQRDGALRRWSGTVATTKITEQASYDRAVELESEYVATWRLGGDRRDPDKETTVKGKLAGHGLAIQTRMPENGAGVLMGDYRSGHQPDYGVLVTAGSTLGPAWRRVEGAVPNLRGALALIDFAVPLFNHDGSREFERPSNTVFHAAETRIAERAFAAESRTGNSDEESDGCPTPTVSVDSTDVVSDEIVVSLQPTGVSGTLVVSLVGSPAHTASTSTLAGGTHTISFGIGSVPTGNYTGVRATWTVGTNAPSDTRAYSFRVLGNYRHSQYNTPSEASCTGTPQSSYVTNNQCTFTSTTLKSDFVSQVNQNGSGYSTNHGTVAPENWCLDPDNDEAEIPDDAEERSFRSGHTVVGSCGAVGNATVAVAPGHDHLSCGDSVYIVGVGVKTVTDRCPGCTSEQLDNYTTNTACHRILDLGTYKTIKL